MGAKLSKKKGGEKSNPKKIVPEVLKASNSANSDVTIIVDGYRFQCLREELSQHSMFFQSMFNSNFKEKEDAEVELRGVVDSEKFDLFLKVVHGERVISDSTVEKLLELADYLESATLEESCVYHLHRKTKFSLREQFQLAETYHAEKLMRQVCNSIKNANELDEVVPKDLNSFCNTTKNIVMQRSFELLGIRKQPLPPLPEEPDQFFEHMINELIDHVEAQNSHGGVFNDQVHLLLIHLFIEKYFREKDETAESIFRGDPLINGLLDQLRNAYEQDDKNFIHAQILVLKLKHFYTRVQNPEVTTYGALRRQYTLSILGMLHELSAMLYRDGRSQFQSHKVRLGSREVDELYRTFTMEAIRNNHVELTQNINNRGTWPESVHVLHQTLRKFLSGTQHQMQRPLPDNQREVSNRASFRWIDEFVRDARDYYYSVPGTRRE